MGNWDCCTNDPLMQRHVHGTPTTMRARISVPHESCDDCAELRPLLVELVRVKLCETCLRRALQLAKDVRTYA